jgi:FAD:protein FMN transferase
VTGALEHAAAAMGTVVSVQVVGCSPASAKSRALRALAWFTHVETACSRFIPESELRQLCATVDTAVPVSDVLFELVQFSVALAEATNGAFDPTVGAAMVARGFDRDWRHGRSTSGVATMQAPATWRDIELDASGRTLRLHRPLLLDLGAVAKGLALDLAARDLADVEHFAIDAGGDVYLAGHNSAGTPWSVGIRHPRMPEQLLTTLQLSGRAVCTSGDYEKRTAAGDGHHVLDPRARHASATATVSATVIADHAMVADGLSTAAFVLGPTAGRALLDSHGVDGLLVGDDGAIVSTNGMALYRAHASHAESHAESHS